MGGGKIVDDMKLLHGDCLELMKEIPDESVDMILTAVFNVI